MHVMGGIGYCTQAFPERLWHKYHPTPVTPEVNSGMAALLQISLCLPGQGHILTCLRPRLFSQGTHPSLYLPLFLRKPRAPGAQDSETLGFQ